MKSVTGNLLVGILFICIIELVYSFFAWWFFAPTDIWIYENAGQTMRFDAIRGYALTPVASRFARITRGEVEYIGTLAGNAQGLPDRDNFTADRPAGVKRRYAVFGDSFTAAQFIDNNWPDTTEDLLASAGEPVQLLNFSIHAGGLANWASLVEGILAREDYELDGLIFAVYGDDLERTFTIADGRNRNRIAFGRVSGWYPASYPGSYAQAKDILDAQEIKATYILSSAEFDAALAGSWQPQRYWEFKVYTALLYQLRRLWRAVVPLLDPNFSAGQLRLIDTINNYTTTRGLPVLVVYLPGQAEASGKTSQHLSRARMFAQQLGADFLDGRDCFAHLDSNRLRELWFTHDEHWNQAGSDLFAGFMADQLRTWPRAR
ncbi:MAG: hypothetical protein WBO57_11180 [Gammaproteobacteria bacterium]